MEGTEAGVVPWVDVSRVTRRDNGTWAANGRFGNAGQTSQVKTPHCRWGRTTARGAVLNKTELFSCPCGVWKQEKKPMSDASSGQMCNWITTPYIHSYISFFLDSFTQQAVFIFKNTLHQNNLKGYRSWMTSYFSVFAFFHHAGHNLVLRELTHLPFQCWQAVFQRNTDFYLFIYLRSPEDCTRETSWVLPITSRYQHTYIFDCAMIDGAYLWLAA